LPLASPHRRGDDGKVRLIERYPLHEPDPAGSLHASIRDLERYLRFQLGDGTWHGRRLLSERSLVEPHTPQVVVRLEGFTELMNPETRFLTYGLGWIVQDYRGKRILMHGGAIDGFRAHLTLVPEEKLGIALLNNLDGSYLNLALSNQILDLYWGAPPRDWNAFYLAIHEEDRKLERERARRLRAEKRGPPPPLPLADYTGTFTDAAYGDCTVVLHEGRLRWRWSSHDCPLEAFNGNTFLMNQPPLTDILVTFEPGADGRLAEMRALSRVFRRPR
jgi:CubicO group peptidase (beta-lactamase class C family)